MGWDESGERGQPAKKGIQRRRKPTGKPLLPPPPPPPLAIVVRRQPAYLQRIDTRGSRSNSILFHSLLSSSLLPALGVASVGESQ